VTRVGLTGGIAAGKSTVARRLTELGAIVIDADELARRVVEPGTPGLAAVRAAFGESVIAADGSLDRVALGALVFADDGARKRLEAIVHPLVRAEAARLEADAARADAAAVVVHDIPLLVETGQGRPGTAFDLVLVVDASIDTQLERLVRDRGYTEEQARSRIGAQASRAERQAAADVVLSNDGTTQDMLAAVDQLWADRLRPHG
jgi:dephospho-CoA kinase